MKKSIKTSFLFLSLFSALLLAQNAVSDGYPGRYIMTTEDIAPSDTALTLYFKYPTIDVTAISRTTHPGMYAAEVNKRYIWREFFPMQMSQTRIFIMTPPISQIVINSSSVIDEPVYIHTTGVRTSHPLYWPEKFYKISICLNGEGSQPCLIGVRCSSDTGKRPFYQVCIHSDPPESDPLPKGAPFRIIERDIDYPHINILMDDSGQIRVRAESEWPQNQHIILSINEKPHAPPSYSVPFNSLKPPMESLCILWEKIYSITKDQAVYSSPDAENIAHDLDKLKTQLSSPEFQYDIFTLWEQIEITAQQLLTNLEIEAVKRKQLQPYTKVCRFLSDVNTQKLLTFVALKEVLEITSIQGFPEDTSLTQPIEGYVQFESPQKTDTAALKNPFTARLPVKVKGAVKAQDGVHPLQKNDLASSPGGSKVEHQQLLQTEPPFTQEESSPKLTQAPPGFASFTELNNVIQQAYQTMVTYGEQHKSTDQQSAALIADFLPLLKKFEGLGDNLCAQSHFQDVLQAYKAASSSWQQKKSKGFFASRTKVERPKLPAYTPCIERIPTTRPIAIPHPSGKNTLPTYTHSSDSGIACSPSLSWHTKTTPSPLSSFPGSLNSGSYLPPAPSVQYSDSDRLPVQLSYERTLQRFKYAHDTAQKYTKGSGSKKQTVAEALMTSFYLVKGFSFAEQDNQEKLNEYNQRLERHYSQWDAVSSQHKGILRME